MLIIYESSDLDGNLISVLEMFDVRYRIFIHDVPEKLNNLQFIIE